MKLRVVIVDDDKDISELLKKAIISLGHDVRTFPDPTKAPFFQDDLCPCEPEDTCSDALIADIVMPNVEGIDLVRKLKKRGCKALMAGNVAIMSGYLTLHYMNELNEMGIQYFRKPFQLEVIYNWLEGCQKRLEKEGQGQ